MTELTKKAQQTQEQATVWIVDDDASIRWVLEAALEDKPYRVKLFDSPSLALKNLENAPPTVIVTDIRMPDMDGMTFMEAVHEMDAKIPVIVMTAHADLNAAVRSYQSKAFEYLPKPFDIDEATQLIERAIKRQLSGGRAVKTRPVMTNKQPLNIIGGAPAMQEVFRIIGRVSQLDVTVLINGETGTGKELIAQALHELSPRADQPFVALNTAAIPRELLESELFGHEKGAFTGAHSMRIGRFEQANGGTLFLDEIGDMPVDLQTRLLRVLNDGSFYRVGGRNPIHAKVRIVAATHQNMEQLVREGRFREDLLYRLNIIRIKIPALRERSEDIPLLLKFYMAKEAKALSLEEKQFDRDVESFLSRLPWPGNVRQLRSLCTWLTIMAPDKMVRMEDLPLEFRQGNTQLAVSDDSEEWPALLRQWADQFLATGQEGLHSHAEPIFERVLIETALQASQFHRQNAAKLLGWGRNTLTRKSQALGLE